MLFDARSELPVATLHARTPGERLLGAMRRRFAWLRPRLVPLTAAVAGTAIVGLAASYLFGLTQPQPGPATAAPPCVSAPQPAPLNVALVPSP